MTQIFEENGECDAIFKTIAPRDRDRKLGEDQATCKSPDRPDAKAAKAVHGGLRGPAPGC
eukprot:COSAG06_NODE_50720_length_316_cov_1.889401_1_plen_59_part_10